MASSDYVNFATRPNKAVERKVIFDTLSRLSSDFGFAEYRYVGFGAVWYVDFVMAHKSLSITDMVSIEEDEYIASRAEFNRPYGCVRVHRGQSARVLPELGLEEKRLLVWLDYDTSVNGPVLKDLTTLCRRALAGSVVIVTINARKGSLPDQDGDGEQFDGIEDALRYFMGDLVGQRLPKGATQTSKYPGFLAGLLFTHMHRQVRKGGREGDRVVPVFNISYSDNAQMATVGVILADEENLERTREAVATNSVIEPMDEKRQLVIGVPPLTFKEKITLDRLLPREDVPTQEVLERLGCRLKPSQVKAYHRFYRYYPTFGELVV